MDQQGLSPCQAAAYSMTNLILSNQKEAPSTVSKGWVIRFIKHHKELQSKYNCKYNYKLNIKIQKSLKNGLSLFII